MVVSVLIALSYSGWWEASTVGITLLYCCLCLSCQYHASLRTRTKASDYVSKFQCKRPNFSLLVLLRLTSK